ncbi:MAG: choice-of-anchor J domain-containing protein, partial [Bacteroidales bacterium]|nr:choice-of-anchor J domain-containing protein [Bacteroidales bacterium]
MKRLLLLVVICAMCSLAFSQNGRIPLTPTATKSGSLQSNSMSGFSTTFSFNSIESQSISNEKGTFSEIYIDGSFPYGDLGSPTLPMITKMIAIPEGATPVVTVNGYSENEYALADYDINTLTAKQAPVTKNIDPTTVEYVVNEAAYARNTYTTDEIASVEYLGTMCGLRLGKLTIRPVAYNAAENTIKVCNDINVTVDFENANAALTQSMFASTYSPAFNSIYDQLLNKGIFGQSTIKGVYDTHTDMYHTPVRMLVICYSGFKNNSVLNQWLAWKLQKGYYVDIFYTDETGTTAANIANFIKTKYNASVSSGNAYSYLLVIGDTGQVPQYTTINVDSSSGNCATDIGYASTDYSSNSDYYPEMLYSRISVENTTHLENYLNKVLTYEKYEFADGGNYLNNVKIIGGWDSSWTSRVAAPTVTYASTYYFNTSNTTYGGFENGNVSTVTSTSSSAGYSGSNNGVYSGINDGFCFLNYTAHGDKQEWYQPKLSATQVASLTNTGKYFFAVGNCCLTGNFNNTSTTYSPGSAIGANACFAETMIRVPNAGAIAYIGNSPVSYWYEDFYWAIGTGVNFRNYQLTGTPTTANTTMGVYDAMFVDEYWNSVSSLLNIGDIAVASAHESNYQTSADANYYWLYYHAFGDGSVMPYVTKPEVNNVTHPASIMAGMTSLTVNAVAGSYVAVTDNESTIYGVAVANAQGVATVNFTEAIPATGTLHVVVTRQQYQPYFGTVDITIANEPYVSIESYSPQNVSFGTTNDLSMTLVNMGGVATEGNTTVNLTTSDEYLTLNTSTATFGVMAAQGGTASSSAFNFSVAENTPDGHVATINATITNGSHTWEGTMTVTVAGPACDAPTGLNVALNGADATITWDTQTITPVIISDDFEDHTYGTINSPGTVGWTYIDGDGANTGTFQGVSYTNGGSPMAFIVLDDGQMTGNSIVSAHSGDKYIGDAYSYTNSGSGWNQQQTAVQNDDWIISPELNFSENFTFSFYARSYSSSYSTEQFYAAYSTTGNSASDFTNLNSTVVTTTTTWTQYSYTVPANAKYVAIHCVSNDQYIFCVDDITISGNEISGVAAVKLYDNGVLVASNLTSGTYTASNLAVGEHCFSIRAICDDNSESMSAQSCVTVESSLPSYTITVNANNGGTVSPNGTQTVTEGNNFTFTATPNDCYEVASVTVDGNNVNLTNYQYTLSNITANHTVNVTFSQISYTIAATAGNGGTITPNGNTTVSCGENKTFAIAANNGYRISNVTVDGQNMGAIESYTFSNVDANHTISATFIAVHTIDVTADADGGSVSPTGTQTIDEGGSFTFTVTPETCYEIGNVTVNGTAVTLDANNQYTINNITSNQNINVTFNQLSYTITATAGNGGTINPGTTTVNCGESQTFAIAANAGYRIVNVTVDGQNRGAIESYTFSNVTANHTISATFIAVLTIDVTADADGGSVLPTGTQTIDEGGSFTFTVTPETCYEIGNVTVNGTAVTLDANNQYTINNITSNQNINVTFNQLSYTITATAGNGGTINPGTTTVTCGGSQTYTIAPSEGYMISNVIVDNQSVGSISSYSFTNVTADHTISATFVEIPDNHIVITVNADAQGGTVYPSGSQSVEQGSDFTFTVTPDACYTIGSVTVNDVAVVLDANNSYTIENVTTEQTVNVSFSQITYIITASAGNGGTITPSGDVNVNCGENKTFAIAASEGYQIADVVVDNESVGAVESYTFNDVTANGHSISATFEVIPANEIEIVINADADGGSVSPTGTQTVTEGDDFTFTVTP